MQTGGGGAASAGYRAETGVEQESRFVQPEQQALQAPPRTRRDGAARVNSLGDEIGHQASAAEKGPLESPLRSDPAGVEQGEPHEQASAEADAGLRGYPSEGGFGEYGPEEIAEEEARYHHRAGDERETPQRNA